MQFRKQAATIPAQIAKLEKCGMDIADKSAAEHCIKSIGYYRLSAYWYNRRLLYKEARLPWFMGGTDFAEIVHLYEFDTKLKQLNFNALEVIEIAFRAAITEHLALTYQPHGYLRLDIYDNPKPVLKIEQDLKRELKKAKSAIETKHYDASMMSPIQHYVKKYDTPFFPPIWITAETLTFGTLSRLLNALKRTDKKAIAKVFALNDDIFAETLRHFYNIRNSCAHHARLYNAQMPSILPTPRSHKLAALQQSLTYNGNQVSRKIYNSLCYLKYFMDKIAPHGEWASEVKALLKSRPIYAPLAAMGFAADWQSRPLWQ